ncbi:MAG: hypothetical protein FJY85_24810, partial [Deltaproteobacteria bacterium]|nr:hypothetical protein [Deltaproteobacteria bacterium]
HAADRTAALVLTQNPEAKRLLLIGGGIGSLLRSFLQYPLDRIDVVEPDPWALPIVRPYLPQEEMEALKDPRVNIIFSDGRLFVNRLPYEAYEAVVCMVPDPVSAFWNRYFTKEFFLAVARALTPTGVFVTRVTSSENFWGAEVASYAGSVYHTMKEVFPFVKGTPGDETVLVASKSAGVVSLDPNILKARYATLGRTRLDPAAFDTIVPSQRTAFVEQELERSPRLINTDLDPVSSSLAMILWGKFSGTAHMEFLNTLRRGGLKAYLIPLALFVIARIAFRARWGPREGREVRFQALLAMAAIGGAAMGIQIVLIYAYQSLFGYVFERIGLIAALFMAGLVVGGFAGS